MTVVQGAAVVTGGARIWWCPGPALAPTPRGVSACAEEPRAFLVEETLYPARRAPATALGEAS